MKHVMKSGLGAVALSVMAACATPAEQAPAVIIAEEATVDPALSALQAERFGALADMVGKTWRGEPLGDSSEQQPDYQQWRWVMDGTALLIRHALADGSYGGDTYVYPSPVGDMLNYVYVTTAGFTTEGSFMLAEDGSWTAEEVVEGHDEITLVRSKGTRGADGSLMSESSYLRNDVWEPGASFLYRETNEPMPTLQAVKILTPE